MSILIKFMDCFIKTEYNILFSIDRIKQYNGAVLCFEGKAHMYRISLWWMVF